MVPIGRSIVSLACIFGLPTVSGDSFVEIQEDMTLSSPPPHLQNEDDQQLLKLAELRQKEAAWALRICGLSLGFLKT